jgi:replicative DNA helicase
MADPRDFGIPDNDPELAACAVAMTFAGAYEEMQGIIGADDFGSRRFAALWGAIGHVVGTGSRADRVTVTAALKASGELDKIGGGEFVTAVAMFVPPRSLAFESYAKIISKEALRRRLRAVSHEIRALADDMDRDVLECASEAERLVFDVNQNQRETDTSRKIGPVLAEVMADLEAQYAAGGRTPGLPSGIPDLDAMLCGFQPGQLIIIGARTGVGKTSFAAQIAAHIVEVAKKPVAFFSLEMANKEIGRRILATCGQVDSHLMRNSMLANSDYARIGRTVMRFKHAPLHLDDIAGPSVMDIRSRARRVASREKGLGAIFVDYLQLVRVPGVKAENRQVVVAEASRGLKLLAREMGVPVIALAQLSRESEKGGDKRPMLSHLRESGSIEQDADVVIFIHRPDLYDDRKELKNTAEIIVAKQRSGPCGIVKATFAPEHTRFNPIDSNWGDR